MAAAIPPKVSRIVDIVVSLGAAVVIIGALFKIEHWTGADQMLIVGLGTEAVVFLIYGILYLTYPPVDDMEVHLPKELQQPAGNPALASMERMLKEADITPVNLSKLSAGFQKLGTTVDKMGEISDVVKATGDYTTKTNEAAAALGTVKDAYSKFANSMNAFSSASESTKGFHDQVQVITKNMSSLNTMYELELQESNNHLKVLNSFYGKLTAASEAMSTSAEDARRAQQQIAALATNLSKLNQVYGGMLTAMQLK